MSNQMQRYSREIENVREIDAMTCFSQQRLTADAKAALNPQHSTLNIQHSTLITRHSSIALHPSILSPQHSTLNTQHSTLNTQHSTLNTQHSALNTQHSTLNTQHSTLNTQHSISTPRFTSAGELTANSIAKWDGTAWSPAGAFDGPVHALALHGGNPAPCALNPEPCTLHPRH